MLPPWVGTLPEYHRSVTWPFTLTVGSLHRSQGMILPSRSRGTSPGLWPVSVLDYVGAGRQAPRNVSNDLYLAVTAVQVAGSRKASRAAGAMWDAGGLPATAVRMRRVGGSAPPVPGQPLESGTELDMAVAHFVAVVRAELGGDSWLNRKYWRLRSWWLRFRHRHGWVRQQLALDAPEVGLEPEPTVGDEGRANIRQTKIPEATERGL
jgi:hypothetical protein